MKGRMLRTRIGRLNLLLALGVAVVWTLVATGPGRGRDPGEFGFP